MLVEQLDLSVPHDDPVGTMSGTDYMTLAGIRVELSGNAMNAVQKVVAETTTALEDGSIHQLESFASLQDIRKSALRSLHRLSSVDQTMQILQILHSGRHYALLARSHSKTLLES